MDIGTKFNPLLRTCFSASESGRFSGIVTTVLRLSSDESQVIITIIIIIIIIIYLLITRKYHYTFSPARN